MFRVFSFLIALSLLFGAFRPAPAAAQTTPGTIVEIASGNRNFSTLVAAVQAAGLVDTLNGAGPFTVFAPTNSAFAKLPKATLDALLADPAALAQILTYHVVSGSVLAADVAGLTSAETVNGQPVVFTMRGGNVYVNNARIASTDIIASNGVIHVIDTVILPPTMDIVDTAAANSQFSTLVAAVQAAGLVDALKAEGPLTVFAPTNDAFARLPAGTVEALLADPAALAQILTYHVVDGAAFSGDARKLSAATTLNGEPITFTTRGSRLLVNGARVITADILATNGVIHVIDRVLLPPTMDLVDLAASNSDFETLVATVQAAGLVDALKGEGPLTVLAPTDAAFARLPRGTVEALLADPDALREILLYHVIDGAVYEADARNAGSAMTMNGMEVAIATREGNLEINGVRVRSTNLLATNGVIHVIDRVLLPPTQNIVETAAGNTNFETLVAAVQAAGLAETLSGEGPYTILAPTDAAFARLPQGTIEALLADPDALRSILLYHVVEGKAFYGDVAGMGSLTTLNGQKVGVTIRNGDVYLNDARVTTSNMLTSNGIIHVINRVLLPAELDIVDTAAGNPQLKTLVAAVQAAGLVDTLKGEGPFTVFAPVDSAFARLPAGTIDALLADPAALSEILTYHVIAGEVFELDAAKMGEATTVNGQTVTFEWRNERLFINGAKVEVRNIITTNGIVHLIDEVLLPAAP